VPTIVDYRTLAFTTTRVGDSGRYIGRAAYWKLYVIENVVRIVIHSVLSAQIGANWWTVAVDPDTLRTVQRVRRSYTRRPWHTIPGKHDLYFVFLPDLIKIMQGNSHLFLPTIPDIDQWIVRLEQIRIPRNIVGHMNWLNSIDKSLIDTTYVDFKSLMKRLSASRLTITIP
jgi:hypothetical protein